MQDDLRTNSINTCKIQNKDHTLYNENKTFININQNEFLTNNYANLSKEIETFNTNNTCFQTQNSIYVNSTYSREYINELKVIH